MPPRGTFNRRGASQPEQPDFCIEIFTSEFQYLLFPASIVTSPGGRRCQRLLSDNSAERSFSVDEGQQA